MSIPQPVAVDLPFRFSATGGVASTRDVDRQIRQRLISIVGTEPRERVMLPEFGVPAARYVFENDSALVAAELSVIVEEQARMWEKGLHVTSVVPVYDNDGKTSLIDVTYRRTDAPGNEGEARFVHTAVLGPHGLEQEVLGG